MPYRKGSKKNPANYPLLVDKGGGRPQRWISVMGGGGGGGGGRGGGKKNRRNE